MATRGRPLKVSRRRTEAFCEAISIGCTEEMAAAYARIGQDTAIEWLKRGKAEIERRRGGELPQGKEQLFVDFSEAVEQARLEAGIRWQAANNGPAWAMRMLRYRFAKDYKEPPSQAEVSGPDGGAIPIAIVKMPVDEL